MIRRLERGSKEERERLSNDMSDTDDPYPHVDDIHDADEEQPKTKKKKTRKKHTAVPTEDGGALELDSSQRPRWQLGQIAAACPRSHLSVWLY